jgi:thiamine kinase-like enzyme
VTAGAREVAFYQLVVRQPVWLPMIVPCYAATYDTGSGKSVILLEDVSASHAIALPRDQQMDTRVNIPPEAVISQVADALARFHAYWWEHPHLGRDPAAQAWRAGETARDQHVQRLADAWARLTAREATWLPSSVLRLYDQALAHLPRVWNTYISPRFRTGTNLTLTHGDAYYANFLCPCDATAGPTYLIDWQCPWEDLSTIDLVPLCAAFWTSAQRHEGCREERLLEHYFQTLQQAGVRRYTWEDFITDYRLALIDWLFMPVQDYIDGAGRDYWWPKLQCLSAAYQDWQCAELPAA